MIHFDRVLPTICLVVIFGLIPKSVDSKTGELCKVKFPNGFFCNRACEKWGVLQGKTFLCFISNDGSYHSFVARNPTFGVWRFFYVDSESDTESICQHSLTGDKFFKNNTETLCSLPDISTRHYKRYQLGKHSAKTQDSQEDLGPPLKRSDYEGKVPLDAICSLATTQVCRQNRMIHCPSAKECCYAETNPEACDEKILGELDECYKVLDSVLKTLLI